MRALKGTCSLLALLALLPGFLQAQPKPDTILTAPSPEPFYSFGSDLDVSVGVDGVPRLLVLELLRPPDRAAYIFARDESSGAWALEDSLGHEVPVSGNLGRSLVFVDGAEPPLAVLQDAGQVVLWRRDMVSGQWEVEAFLEGIDKPGGAGAGFGSGLAGLLLPSGEELLFIGAQNGGDDPTGGSREGSAYAFVRQSGATEWVMEARILAPDGIEGDLFGASVALLALPDGHVGDAMALVGAPHHPNPDQKGAVYVYLRDGATGQWSFEAKLVSTDPQSHHKMGIAVAAAAVPGGESGEIVVLAGSQTGDCTGNPGASGSATVFERTPDGQGGGTWAMTTIICPHEAVFDSRYGSSVALAPEPGSGEGPVRLRALVGTDPGDSIAFADGVDLFVRDAATGAWSLQQHYDNNELFPDWYGSSVALAGDMVFIGAYRDDTAGTNAGAVYVYDVRIIVAEEPGLPDAPEGLSLSVYPNPARGEAEIRLGLAASEHPASSAGQAVRVVLYDVLGREVAVPADRVFGAGESKLTLDVSRLAVGTYAIRVESPSGARTALVTVVR